jgi:UDP-3-O-[3-hydroxymyristoyl] N-acetylglucosamine deacetylase
MQARFEGMGLHTGETCAVTVRLGGAQGIVFQTAQGGIPLAAAQSSASELCTALRHGTAAISTVEHLLAALTGLGHHAAVIDVEGPEVPILDGSAAPFAKAFGARQPGPAALVVEQPFEVACHGARARVEPATALDVDYSIEFPEPIGTQSLRYRHDAEAFRAEVAPARTFTLAAWVEAMRAQGRIRGGSLDCALVFGPEGPLNPPLRYADEPVRHKVLDLMGDLALLGRPLRARLYVERGGHALHGAVVAELKRRLASGEGVRLA